MDDILIRGGQVIDGSGAPARHADVAISGGRISAIADRYAGHARREIDAAGLVVAPGFIDIHTHSDFTLPLNPRAESKIRQGVTTEVLGNCGFSAAPALPGRVEMLRDYLGASAPWLEFRETSFTDYLDTFPATSVNTIMQVGHNTLRLMAMGMEDRAPAADELVLMQHLLAEALDAGALGLSSGLFTAPGTYAKPEEMIALGHVLKRHGGAYSSHVRDEANHVFEAVEEAIAVGETCGIHVQIAHLKLSGTDNWGGAAKLLAGIDAARSARRAGRLRSVPYTAGSNPLRNLLPPWVQEGGMEAMLRRLGRACRAGAHPRRDRRPWTQQFRPDSFVGCGAHRHLAPPVGVRRAHHRRYRPRARSRSARRGMRVPDRRPRPYPDRRRVDVGRGRAGDRPLRKRAGGLRRHFARALRDDQPGQAAPALLRHVPARARALRPGSGAAFAAAGRVQDDRRLRCRARA